MLTWLVSHCIWAGLWVYSNENKKKLTVRLVWFCVFMMTGAVGFSVTGIFYACLLVDRCHLSTPWQWLCLYEIGSFKFCVAVQLSLDFIKNWCLRIKKYDQIGFLTRSWLTIWVQESIPVCWWDLVWSTNFILTDKGTFSLGSVCTREQSIHACSLFSPLWTVWCVRWQPGPVSGSCLLLHWVLSLGSVLCSSDLSWQSIYVLFFITLSFSSTAVQFPLKGFSRETAVWDMADMAKLLPPPCLHCLFIGVHLCSFSLIGLYCQLYLAKDFEDCEGLPALWSVQEGTEDIAFRDSERALRTLLLKILRGHWGHCS